jgi:hypothetical protein
MTPLKCIIIIIQHAFQLVGDEAELYSSWHLDVNSPESFITKYQPRIDFIPFDEKRERRKIKQ